MTAQVPALGWGLGAATSREASGSGGAAESPPARPISERDGSGGDDGEGSSDGNDGEGGAGGVDDRGEGGQASSLDEACRAYEQEALELAATIEACPSFDAGGCVLYAEAMAPCAEPWVDVFTCLLGGMSVETCSCGEDGEFRCEGCDAEWSDLLTCLEDA